MSLLFSEDYRLQKQRAMLMRDDYSKLYILLEKYMILLYTCIN